MDYGAMLKRTAGHFNERSAHYAKQSKFVGSRRQLRGAVLRAIATKGFVTTRDFSKRTPVNFSVADILQDLVVEGFLRKKGNVFKFT